MHKQKFMIIGGASLNTEVVNNFDQRIIQLSGKDNPSLLFIPTASKDNEQYVLRFTNYFHHLGAQVKVLYLYKEKTFYDAIKAKIEAADIVYVGGGNTLRMMNLWRRLGVDKLLGEAWHAGKVLCGSSAGSICWFDHGNSDSRKDNNPAADYIKVTALGFLSALHCPHYDSEYDRQESIKKMLQKYKGVGIALDDFAALEIIGDTYKLVAAQPQAKGYKLYWKGSIFYKQEIMQENDYQTLSHLLQK